MHVLVQALVYGKNASHRSLLERFSKPDCSTTGRVFFFMPKMMAFRRRFGRYSQAVGFVEQSSSEDRFRGVR